jgi:hypothetical protein
LRKRLVMRRGYDEAVVDRIVDDPGEALARVSLSIGVRTPWRMSTMTARRSLSSSWGEAAWPKTIGLESAISRKARSIFR